MSKEELISDWEIRLTKAQVGHYVAAERYIFWHYLMGITLIILSAFVTSSLFLNSTVDYVQNIIIVASIFSTILAGFQTLVRPSEQAEIHRSKAVKYGILRREIELFLSSDKSEDKKEKFLEKLKSNWNNIADNSPVTPRSLRIKASEVLSNDLVENRELRNIKNPNK